MHILEIFLGLAGLIAGGELLVRGAVAAASRFGVSPLIVGLTIVGFGTSSPELVTSMEASLAGAPGIAIGNVVGSNIANILLILGITALMAPVVVQPSAFWRDGTMLLATTVIGVGVLASGAIGRGIGAVFQAILAIYVIATYLLERRRNTTAAAIYTAEASLVPAPAVGLASALAMVGGGLILTVFAAKFLVSGAVTLATSLGVPETMIGLTIVAVGTSMPELVTSIVAARRGQSDLAFGNIIGSNIFNILGILGATAMVQPLTVPAAILEFDVWLMLAVTLVLCVFAVSGWRISRREGLAMTAAYLGYTLYLVSFP